MKKIILLVMIAMLAGCNFEQDPYKKYSGEIQRPIPPGKAKTPNEKPLPNNSMFIDVDPVFTLTETKETKFTVSGHMTADPLPFHIEIENLNSMNGAAFDKNTGLFSWTPPMGTIEFGYQKVFPLIAVMVTDSDPVYTVRKEVSLIVTRLAKQPKVLSYEFNDKPRGGRAVVFSAIVESIVEPRLHILPASTDDISTFIYIKRFTKMANDQWEFTLVLDLTRANPPGAGTYNFGLQATVPYADPSFIIDAHVPVEAAARNANGVTP
jgi:hypothetical protein